MRRNASNVCEIINVICPYKLHCNDCDVHNSYDRAYRLSHKKFPSQSNNFINIEELHKSEGE